MNMAGIFSFLVHAYGSVHAVVHDDKNNIEAVVYRSRQLLPVHQVVPVTVEGNDRTTAIGDFRRARGGHAIAHGAAGRRELRTKTGVAVKAMKPAGKISRAVGVDRIDR